MPFLQSPTLKSTITTPRIAAALSMDLHLFGVLATQELLDAVARVALARHPETDAVLGEARVVGRRLADLRQSREREHAEQVREAGEQDHRLVADDHERRERRELLATHDQRVRDAGVDAEREPGREAEQAAHE